MPIEDTDNASLAKTIKLRRLQLISECSALLISTVVFSKLILFTKYPILNMSIKFFLLYSYSASMDPLIVFSGYYATKIY